MESSELQEKAQAYVEASNTHDLTAIKGMFARDAVYRSSGVGGHAGIDRIIAMMRTFFSDNPDVHWKVDDYRALDDHCVQFTFIISMNGKSSPGTERIHFNRQGSIRLIEVMR